LVKNTKTVENIPKDRKYIHITNGHQINQNSPLQGLPENIQIGIFDMKNKYHLATLVMKVAESL
jgi:hypothetical protein